MSEELERKIAALTKENASLKQEITRREIDTDIYDAAAQLGAIGKNGKHALDLFNIDYTVERTPNGIRVLDKKTGAPMKGNKEITIQSALQEILQTYPALANNDEVKPTATLGGALKVKEPSSFQEAAELLKALPHGSEARYELRRNLLNGKYGNGREK